MKTIAKYGNCFQNNRLVTINSMFNECSAVHLHSTIDTLNYVYGFTSDSSAWDGNPHEFLTRITCYIVPGPVTSLQVRPSTTRFGLIITWGPPSGSNYPTPVTYQLRYRERPSSGSPGDWSSTVQRTATQRQYTTPVLKPSTRYEVQVWAVCALGHGQNNIFRTASTRQCM